MADSSSTTTTATDQTKLSIRERAALNQAELTMRHLDENNGYGDGDGSVRDFFTLFKSLRQYKAVTIATPIFVAFEAIFEVLIPTLMAFLIDDGLSKHNITNVWMWGGILLAVSIASLLFGIFAGRFAARAATGLSRNLRHDLFEKVQGFSFTNIDRFSSGSLVTRLTTDVTNVQNSFQMLIRVAFRAPLMVIFAWFFTYRTSPSISMVYLILIPIVGAALIWLSMSVHPIFIRVFRIYDRLNSNVEEDLAGVRVVKSFTREDYEDTKFKYVSQAIYHFFVKAEMRLTFFNPILTGSIYVAMLTLSWMAAHQIVASGNRSEYGLTTGDLTSLITYTMQILMAMMMISFVFIMIIISRASASRIAAVLNEESTVTTPDNPLTEVADGSIKFKDVSFRYSESSEKEVLSHIDIDIPSGSTVGIVGGTGSAKSSLVQLIPRLYDATDGSVRVGGRDVRNYDLDVLRNEVGMVLQKNILFTGTIAENLRWGNPNATDEEIRHAAHLACADEFIEQFPDGYDSHVEQGGANFSGGQRQRLCIARALLKKPKVLILDDSTSAVDTKTDASIRNAFAKEIPDTTKIIIAQRISSVEHADQIIVMNEGKILDHGTHEQLMQTCEEYRSIAQSQSKGGAIDE
ncbi:ABC transporter ATP-binding protein [Alloscardovia theropitheci]|uniref:ABC transporter ATP-binding protein n=1 Tax=Alloscardovia theropitheci TaxID=2496842 RepID=A0A4R0QS61_9BIFI|nr:ABC transporter ATP-binding protein [Alloscardovia theropitheci]TCD54238.1 ABC transporter ATP-binding protein [Alloscardovia theropitheci]